MFLHFTSQSVPKASVQSQSRPSFSSVSLPFFRSVFLPSGPFFRSSSFPSVLFLFLPFVRPFLYLHVVRSRLVPGRRDVVRILRQVPKLVLDLELSALGCPGGEFHSGFRFIQPNRVFFPPIRHSTWPFPRLECRRRRAASSCQRRSCARERSAGARPAPHVAESPSGRWGDDRRHEVRSGSEEKRRDFDFLFRGRARAGGEAVKSGPFEPPAIVFSQRSRSGRSRRSGSGQGAVVGDQGAVRRSGEEGVRRGPFG